MPVAAVPRPPSRAPLIAFILAMALLPIAAVAGFVVYADSRPRAAVTGDPRAVGAVIDAIEHDPALRAQVCGRPVSSLGTTSMENVRDAKNARHGRQTAGNLVAHPPDGAACRMDVRAGYSVQNATVRVQVISIGKNDPVLVR